MTKRAKRKAERDRVKSISARLDALDARTPKPPLSVIAPAPMLRIDGPIRFIVSPTITKKEMAGLISHLRDDEQLSMASWHDGLVLELNVDEECLWRAER